MLFDIHHIISEDLHHPILQQKNIQLSIARLDKLHAVVSGNKLFKLHYFLEQYKKDGFEKIETYGGPYSNHLVATAYACRESGIPCKAFVRGEEPAQLSHTLLQCKSYGMQLEFLSRDDYAASAAVSSTGNKTLVIPEGGFHPLGAKGASLIIDGLRDRTYSHICLAVGTATTLAGILQAANLTQQVVAIPVLKGFEDINQRLEKLNGRYNYNNLHIWKDHHFGGYAKKTAALIDFMNNLFREHRLPTDFVYTGKMMFAVLDGLQENRFPAGSHILCLHTGGLQGNESLPAGTLIF